MDWFSDIGRRVWLAYQEGLEMTCPAHRECVKRPGQIAARDSASALPGTAAEFSASYTFVAQIDAATASGNGSAADDSAAAFQHGSTARH
ncbi:MULTISPECIES: hypothetical protein [Novosphingobium]|uniref:hypothetical protein n=1 Tax=Novosphingobium TaxID=165696 RepID=UPI000787248E|nr:MULTISPECIES: hypothetical protein [Novosphingobium]PTR08596.1 hypothetical protein C8K11_11138 [Novosphingobium sp. GV055]PUB01319.1 hypothetical protein C8K12_11138 [Novosphingobium sp. GV061]PUB16893.1 hypothetical protein C8K14_11138 [Novosphingobium sp. GV079]PUB39916.1 hypothetical protein C8K10_11138 [Novosphingobium sp. GV027]WQD91903.1 hypothetical protein U0041_12950 [Novosphingobium capsulatum]